MSVTVLYLGGGGTFFSGQRMFIKKFAEVAEYEL